MQNNSGNGSFTRHDDYYALTGQNLDGMLQRFEKPLITGQTYTCSLLTKEGQLLSGFMVYNGENSGFNFPNSKWRFILIDNSIWAPIIIDESSVETINVAAVKLEYGSCQTLARKENGKWVLNDPPPNKASELLKCQRYYFRTSSNMFFSSTAWTARISGIVVPCPVPLRALPAMTLINNYAKLWIGSSLIDTSHLTFRVETMDSAGLRVAADSNIDLPLGSCCLVDLNTGSRPRKAGI